MLRYLVRRLLQALPVLLLVAAGVFVLLELAEGDAVDAYLAGIGGAGDLTLAAELRERYGLADSLGARFLTYAWSLATLDLGWSIAFARPVLDVILERLPKTLLLMGSGILLAALLGIGLGALAALRQGRPTDTAVTTTALVLNATPGFWLGLLLIIVFAVKLRWLPLGGFSTLDSRATGLEAALDTARHLVLPAGTLGLTYFALYLRLMRGAMLDAAGSGWVTAARARGLPRGRIVLRHMARPALLPVVTMLGLQSGTMLGGSVVVETVFAIPGLGSLAYEAVSQRDLPLLAGILLAGTVLVVLVNILVDLLYGRLDPRVGDHLGRAGGE